MKVEQILQAKGADVFAVKESDSLKQAVAVLTEKNVGAVVVEDGQASIVGILSERDVVRYLNARGAEALALQVRECMTPEPVTCGPEASIEELMSHMTERRIRHIPVMNGGKIIGVVSIGDVVKRKIEEAENEAQALKEYIAS